MSMQISLGIFVLLLTLASNAQEKAPQKNALNPDISAILDLTGGYAQRNFISRSGDDPKFDGDSSSHASGFTMQEAELALSSIVDPYFKGEFYLAIPNSGEVEIEEAFATTLALPSDLQIKAGKFRSSIGRQNGQHLHLQDFTRRPLINQYFLGGDGLNGTGVQVSWLVPLPFYSLIAVEGLSVKGTTETSDPVQTFGGDKRDPTLVATWKNFFPLSEETSMYLGLSYAKGRSATALDTTTSTRAAGHGLRSQLAGADLYLKYKPANAVRGFYSLTSQTEYYFRFLGETHTSNAQNDGGFYTQLVYQIAQRWFLGVRADIIGLPRSLYLIPTKRFSTALTYAPSEFSRIRLYAENETVSTDDYPTTMPASSSAYLVQFEVSIGAHGSHAF